MTTGRLQAGMKKKFRDTVFATSFATQAFYMFVTACVKPDRWIEYTTWLYYHHYKPLLIRHFHILRLLSSSENS